MAANRANSHPSGCDPSATGHRLGTRRLRELLAVRGDAGLWLADDDFSGETLVRLYPGLPTAEEWHRLELAASQLVHVVDARLVPIEQVTLDVWPCLSFTCPDGESLARRIAREPMTPEAAVAMCADVTAALAVLARAGVPPVDVSPADVVLVGERARLLPDVGLQGGRLARACVDLDHVAPERAAAIADRAHGRPAAAYPVAESTTYALASIVAAAIHGPARPAVPAQLEMVLRRGLAQSPSARYGTPAALVEALDDALGDHPSPGRASAPRANRARRASAPPAPRARPRSAPPARPARRVSAPPAAPAAPAAGARTAVAPRRTRRGRRRLGIAIPAVLLLVAAAAIGAVAGSATTPPEPPATVTLAGAGLSVEAPQGWLRGAGEVLPAIGAPALVAHPPGPSSTSALVVTRAAAPLLAKLADAVPAPVRLGEHDAWRYRDVAVDAASVADVYVLEDGDGAIVAACLGPPDASLVRGRCSAALTTLQLDAGRATALGGGAAARSELARVVEDLDRTRGRERRALTAARTGRGQAAAADRLAAAYARAAGDAATSGTVGAPGDLARLADRLRETGRAYAALATAARASRRPAYAQARERVVAHERALHEDLAALGSASPSP